MKNTRSIKLNESLHSQFYVYSCFCLVTHMREVLMEQTSNRRKVIDFPMTRQILYTYKIYLLQNRKWSMFFGGSVIFHNRQHAFCQFVVSTINYRQQQLDNRLLVELLLVSRFAQYWRMPVRSRVHNPLTLLTPTSSSPMGFTLISNTITRSRYRNKQCTTSKCTAFTLRVVQMETVTLATSTTGKKSSRSYTEAGWWGFVCFQDESIHLNLHSNFLYGEVCLYRNAISETSIFGASRKIKHSLIVKINFWSFFALWFSW